MLLSITDIAAISDKVHWSGSDSFTACCIAHDDSSPSMSVTQNGEMLLLHCHAGCSQDELLAAAGIRIKEGVSIPVQRPTEGSKRRCLGKYAADLWNAAGGGVPFHAYAQKKRITHAFKARRGIASGSLIGQLVDCVLVPGYDWDGNFIGVECINREGTKQSFGKKGVLVLGNPEQAAVIHVCEGWATAWAIGHLFPKPYACIVSFGKGRLDSVAAEAEQRYDKNILIHVEGSDNRDVWDLWINGEGEKYAQRVTNARK